MYAALETMAPLLARIFLGGYFLWSGIQKALNFQSAVSFFSTWDATLAPWLALVAISVEVGAGLAVVVGLRVRAAALWLVLYVLLTSALFFKVLATSELQLFLEHVALVGGLLLLATTRTSAR